MKRLAVLLAAAHFLWLLAHFSPATMSPDANGYVVQARALAEHGTTAVHPEHPAQFVGMHWIETSDGTFRSRYPPGLPTLMAAGWLVGGPTAALLVNPLLASGTVLLVFFLARRYAPDPVAFLAEAAMAAAPLANEHALAADAHTATTFLLLAGLVATLHADDDPRYAALAGLLLGCVPAFRYPETLAAAAVALWLVTRQKHRAWPALVPLGALLAYHAAVYGSPWSTGYALWGEQGSFAWGYARGQLLPYLEGLAHQLGLFFALGAAGMLGMAATRDRRSEGLLLLAMTLPLLVLYAAYYFGTPQENQRFYLPLYPAFLAGGAWLLGRIPGRPGAVVTVAVAVLALTPAFARTTQVLDHAGRSLKAAADLRRLAQQHVPRGAVLVADRDLAASLDATGEWLLVDEDLLLGREAQDGVGFGPDPSGGASPVRHAGGRSRAWRERYGSLPPAERPARVRQDLEGRPLYWLTLGRAPGQPVARAEAPLMMACGRPPQPGHAPVVELVRLQAGGPVGGNP